MHNVLDNIFESKPVNGTSSPLHPLLNRRRSTRAFSAQPVDPAKLRSVLEAARWAPSASNSQPWRFVVATGDDPDLFERMSSLLADANRLWASKAPVLILTAARVADEKGRQPHKFAYHDVGQATAQLTVQATSLGLSVHQMGGFDALRAKQVLDIPEEYEPVVILALGYEGSMESLPGFLQEREIAPRIRKPLSELVFERSWDQPSHLVAGTDNDNLHNTTNN